MFTLRNPVDKIKNTTTIVYYVTKCFIGVIFYKFMTNKQTLYTKIKYCNNI